MTLATIDKPKSKIVIRISKRNKKPSKNLIKKTIAKVFISIVVKLRNSHPIFKYFLFFGAASLGSLSIFLVLKISLIWTIFNPLFIFGYEKTALLLTICLLWSLWATGTLVWFEFLDKTF